MQKQKADGFTPPALDYEIPIVSTAIGPEDAQEETAQQEGKPIADPPEQDGGNK